MTMISWSPGVTLEDIEEQVIRKAFAHFRNKTATAFALGISIRTLDNKFEKYDKRDEEHRKRENEERERRKELLNRARGLPVHAPETLPSPEKKGEREEEIDGFEEGFQTTKLKKRST